MKEYIFLYQTKCLVNGKTYIGVHKTDNLNDGYIGCGVFSQGDAKRETLLFQKAVRKHGYSNFERYIYSFYDTYEEALEEERWIVNNKWVKSSDNYNVALGGRGSTTFFMDEERKKELKNKISSSVRKWLDNGGAEKMKLIEPTIKRVKKFGKDNSAFGKPNVKRRAVLQFDKNMNIIKRYDYILQAAEQTGFHLNSISKCCVGVNKTTMGFIFRYENYSEEELERLNKNLIRKKRVSNRKGCKLPEQHRINIIKAKALYFERKKNIK